MSFNEEPRPPAEEPAAPPPQSTPAPPAFAFVPPTPPSYGAPPEAAVPKPASPMVIGIILLVFAFFSLAGIVTLVVTAQNPAVAHPIPVEVGILIDLVFGGLYLLMGIGLIKGLAWARVGTILFCCAVFLETVIVMPFSMQHIVTPPNSSLDPALFHLITTITLVASLVFSAAINATFIILLTRPAVVAYFARKVHG